MSAHPPPVLRQQPSPSGGGARPELFCQRFTEPCYRDGKYVILHDGSQLPERCVKTGKPAGRGTSRVRRKISWIPSWVLVMIPVGIVLNVVARVVFRIHVGPLALLLLFSMFMRRTARVTYSLGKKGKEGRAIVLSMAWVALGVAFGVGFLIFRASVDADAFGRYWLVACLALAISLLLFSASAPLRAAGYRNGWFRVKGASRAFPDTLPEADWRQF